MIHVVKIEVQNIKAEFNQQYPSTGSGKCCVEYGIQLVNKAGGCHALAEAAADCKKPEPVVDATTKKVAKSVTV